jgi:hypothetical protein
MIFFERVKIIAGGDVNKKSLFSTDGKQFYLDATEVSDFAFLN